MPKSWKATGRIFFFVKLLRLRICAFDTRPISSTTLHHRSILFLKDLATSGVAQQLAL